jgi:hypothetical protein
MKHGIIDKDGALIKHRIIDENAISILCIIGVLFIGFCILFSGGRYESLGVIKALGSGHSIQYVATIDKFTGTTLITKIECSFLREERNSKYKTYCTKDLVPDSYQF